MAMKRNVKIHRYQYFWNESPTSTAQEDSIKLVAPCLEDRVS
jgi:hypothetical protein